LKNAIPVALLSATALSLTLTACSSDSDDENTVVTQTVTEQAAVEPEASAAPAAAEVTEETEAPVEDLEIPAGLEGMNGQLAYEQLKDAGFTGVVPTSVDPTRAMPIMYNNWTITSVEPAAGTVVPADSTVILNMTKE